MKAVLLVLLALSPVVTRGGEQNANTDHELPKVVLIGDSIRLSYAPIVSRQLAGVAVVVSPEANGGDSSNVLKNLQRWVTGEQPAIVHFNCGIHDTKKFKSTGKFQIPPDTYEANLREIVERIRDKTGAVVLFATTTPILDDRAAAARQDRDYELLGASVEQYNAIARKVMTELDVSINDLHKIVSEPELPLATTELVGKDGVHMTERGRELLGSRVAEFVSQYLEQGE